ncbi:MAG: hypothetical protein MUE40_08550 [Anaerolineae bacterium]|jgi:hypothetical protein|nr:hypothetical protein [Anaerolineae bacterium]
MTRSTRENAGEFVAACLTTLYGGPYLMSFLSVAVPAVFAYAAAHPTKITIGNTLVILEALARARHGITAGVQDGADPTATKLFIDYLRELVEKFGGDPGF